MQLHIGIDDTDSTTGGCTTYLAARLVEKFAKLGARFLDYPNIIRLNPNIPYKTRGNAAVALRLDIQDSSFDTARELALDEIETRSHFGRRGTEPGIVILQGHPTRKIIRFSQRALFDVLSARKAVTLIRSSGTCAVAYGADLGLVGAIAAIGQILDLDHTFELVAYRRKENCGFPRRVDEESVKRMDRLTYPKTFNNYDYDNKRVLITPHGPDPVLFGIRGEDPRVLRTAFQAVRVLEPIERWIIFRTNHGTDAHFASIPKHFAVRSYRPLVLRAVVDGKPRRIRGGHVFFDVKSSRRRFTCAAYEEAGKFREIAANLLPGDEVTIYGCTRGNHKGRLRTINLEKLFVHRLGEVTRNVNPSCPMCGKRLKSAGRGQGYRCEKCSLRRPDAKKQIVREARKIGTGLYVPTPKAHRHLTKPLCRYGQEKIWDYQPPVGTWHVP